MPRHPLARAATPLLLAALAGPAQAWTFSPVPVCTIAHETAEGSATVTFDPATALYAISLQRDAPWPAAPLFSIRFEGPRGLAISTDRHVLADGGHRLTVTDTGFGNVLDGLQYNRLALPRTGNAGLPLPLEGAAEAVAAFRACALGGMS